MTTNEIAEDLISPPLCVDLDGTLVKSDTLLDALSQMARRQPLKILHLPVWAAKGRAFLKSKLAHAAPLDVARLPYNMPLLRYLQAEHRNRRQIYLTTGADQSVALRVAEHLELFDAVFASDGIQNLTGSRKLSLLKSKFPSFDYIGNAWADLPLLEAAQRPMIANATAPLRVALKLRMLNPAAQFNDRRPLLPTLFKAVRIHQWAKNLLLLAPLLFSHKLNRHSIAAAIAAFFCFSFIASANYLLNDLLDMDSDRHHRSKRFRPFAAGDLDVKVGGSIVVLLSACSLALLPWLPAAFAFWLAVYILSTSAYSFYFKRIAIVDVLLLSGLYTIRLLAGGAATATPISHWLAGFSTFLFLSLAMVKRFSELENLRERGASAALGRGYTVADIEQIRSFGTASATAAVVVFAVYISWPDVTVLYRHPERLWLIVPLLLFWLYRVWLLASRGELDDDPVVFAVRDLVSLLIFAAILGIAVLAV